MFIIKIVLYDVNYEIGILLSEMYDWTSFVCCDALLWLIKITNVQNKKVPVYIHTL